MNTVSNFQTRMTLSSYGERLWEDTALPHHVCHCTGKRIERKMEVLTANSHSFQRYDEFCPSLPVGCSQIQDMGGAEGKAAYIGRSVTISRCTSKG